MNLLIALVIFAVIAAALVSAFVAWAHGIDDEHDWESDENEPWIHTPFVEAKHKGGRRKAPKSVLPPLHGGYRPSLQDVEKVPPRADLPKPPAGRGGGS